ncbi:unnamed protein product, partial [Discosporangium mesarthrocarpum]
VKQKTSLLSSSFCGGLARCNQWAHFFFWSRSLSCLPLFSMLVFPGVGEAHACPRAVLCASTITPHNPFNLLTIISVSPRPAPVLFTLPGGLPAVGLLIRSSMTLSGPSNASVRQGIGKKAPSWGLRTG